MTSSSSSSRPVWTIKDPGSFSSIHVSLPPRSSVNCESDAVVAYSKRVRVRGEMTGGLFSSLARAFFTNESFFTTVVENIDPERPAKVMMAPSGPGAVVLHECTASNGGGGGSLYMTSGSYVASDANVKIESTLQSGMTRSMLSGTGLCLLRATVTDAAAARGKVALGCFGAVHAYELRSPDDELTVDNGHLVAWSDTATYRMIMASSSGVVDSLKSGEGLMCRFQGPGTVYVQSHKPPPDTDRKSGSGGRGRRGSIGLVGATCGGCFAAVFISIWLMVMIMVILGQGATKVYFEETYDSFTNKKWPSYSSYEPPTNIGYEGYEGGYYRHNEF